MNSLVGVVYQNGHIEFSRDDNRWAFRRIDAELQHGQEDRIVVNPELAPIEVELSANLKPEDVPWLDRTRALLNSADTIYLQAKRESLRFRQCIHNIKGDREQLITLATLEEAKAFANQHWQQLRRFFAQRHDGFGFDLVMVISAKSSESKRENCIEVVANLREKEGEELPRLTFNATGSGADVSIVDWRKTVPEGETGRFAPDDSDISLTVGTLTQPLTFLYQYRDDFHNRAFVFFDKQIDNRLKKIQDSQKA